MTRRKQLEELLKEDSNDAFLQYGLALEDAKEGEVLGAASRLEKLLKDQPEYLGAYYQLGQWYEQLSEIEKAKAIYELGIVLAKKLGNKKTEGEMRTALENLE